MHDSDNQLYLGKADVHALAHLRKESLDLYNRVHSIEEDTKFVNAVHEAYHHLPILPNLRCGAWYVDPDIASPQPAYFKSTDGHFGAWSFNLRRPNLHLLGVLVANGGLVLVDSTRAGKRIPDALAKTVPIWCAVINRAIRLRYPKAPVSGWNSALYCPPGAVSAQEHSQIEARLDAWAQSLSVSSYDLPNIVKPLRPLWITPSTSVFPSLSSNSLGFLPVICISASKQIQEGMERRSHGFAYVQGSGDDHELWGMGLTPELFWANRVDILESDRAELPALVSALVARQKPRTHTSDWRTTPTPVLHVAGLLSIAALRDLPSSLPGTLPNTARAAAFVIIGAVEASSESASEGDSPSNLHLEMATGKKKAQHAYLSTVLPRATAFIGAKLSAGAAVCICCESGTDASVGVALAALQLFFDDAGNCAQSGEQGASKGIATKQSIATRLQWLIASRPQANPSRTTLKRVNEFLLSSPFCRHKHTAANRVPMEGSVNRSPRQP